MTAASLRRTHAVLAAAARGDLSQRVLHIRGTSEIAETMRSVNRLLDRMESFGKESHAALQRLCPQAVLAAHVKSGAKKHPGPYVSQTAGNRLACVSEEPGTEVQMRFRH